MKVVTNKRFVVRVYGLLFNPAMEVLVADEVRNVGSFSKFPGGGVEWGEGLLEALRREFLEETGWPLSNIQHFYTTDFFQQSAFSADDQIISVYYLVTSPRALPDVLPPPVTEIAGSLSFRWVSQLALSPELFTFPIDKFIVPLLKNTELALKF